jgi:hypothetical protein
MAGGFDEEAGERVRTRVPAVAVVLCGGVYHGQADLASIARGAGGVVQTEGR